MIVAKERLGTFILLRIAGVIKLGQSARFFANALKSVLAEEGSHVMVDLSGIDYIDSTGIGELVGHLVKLQSCRRKLILIHPSERVRKLLRIAQVESLFPTYDNAEAALCAES